MSEYLQSLDAITELAAWYSEHEARRNEATTRLQLIDRVFFECLGWSRDDVSLEEPYGGQYADYTFIFPRKLLIAEAKKEGVYFELPAGPMRLQQSISALLRTTPELRSAMEQVATYCQKRGVPYATVTNGHQFITFVATRSDGLPPFEGMAMVFNSLTQARDNFLEFWNLLSKSAMEQQLLRARLLGQTEVNLPPKLSATLHPYPGTKGRNPFQASMKLVSELILEDITKAPQLERQFLKACYCASGALSEYSLQNKQILEARYAALFDSGSPGPTTAPAVQYGLVNAEILAQSFSRRPILLIGDVGVGKTTFIRQLINTDPAFADKAIALYIDFGSKGTLAEDLKSYIISEIDRQLAKEHHLDTLEDQFVRRVYSLDLQRFAGGVNKSLQKKKRSLFEQKEIEYLEQLLSKREEHMRLSLAQISMELRKQIVIFLDNTDQRSEQDQQAAFLIAQEMANRWQAMIYITLRPETYHASMRRGALTGYHPKAFTIAPPRIDRVIRKRLVFALKVTMGRVLVDNILKTAHLDLSSLEILLRVFLRSTSTSTLNTAPSSRRHDLMRCVENIAAGNVRLALELVRGFFGSGHVDTQKIINKVKDEGGYHIPLHEFQRAMIYGDNVHYDPSRSPVANIFDISTADLKEHFLQGILIAFLRLPGIQRSEEGFVPVKAVYEYCQGLGFTPEQVDFAVTRCVSKRLLETAARRIPEPGRIDGFALRPTSLGLYHIQELLGTFTYLDAVTVDTPILEKNLREFVVDAHSLADRVERAFVFREYLDQAWAALPTTDLPLDWPTKSQQVLALLTRLNPGKPAPVSLGPLFNAKDD